MCLSSPQKETKSFIKFLSSRTSLEGMTIEGDSPVDER